MPQTVTGFGVFLILVSLAFFAMFHASPTALIPAYFGLAIALAGVAAIVRPAARRHAMHAAAVLALIGLAMPGFMVVRTLAAAAGGAEIARPAAVALQAIMAVACGLLLALCVRSFIAARRPRPAGRKSAI
ncbi:MAG: hypothetical protein IT442_16535 [Phycisphaeraceae bacterium]|nr:hypothetical protein [Phycisphaeraceae bacterium]